MLSIYKTIQKNKSDLKHLFFPPSLCGCLSDLPQILDNSLLAANTPFASLKIFLVLLLCLAQ